ncbi:cyclodeaminase/cyclohydrolase family protein [Pseudoramibacter faecis]|uniref:cyclodeaminase/cyclohydrolase family protein n=1 Tax=Pseudoramibacter faecis TaxID=3108534 RepID=UPI002E79EC6F|nr:cyclodeaminase/cyclohydrolase family protein [Pseudoramibacter sp. HA2172]
MTKCEQTYDRMPCAEFVLALASNAPTPGGGGASALVGAVGVALGQMVAALTIGKEKYADVEDVMIAFNHRAQTLQEELCALIDRDAEVFAPLSDCYRMSASTAAERQAKDEAIQACLDACCEVPLRIMTLCCEGIAMAKEFAENGSRLAVSDAGCSAAILNGALHAAALNVLINTRNMADTRRAAAYNEEANRMLAGYGALADSIYKDISKDLQSAEEE